ETIERLFGTAKEYHNLRYTREKGKSKMEDKVGLTLACLNLKKLVKRMAGEPFYFVQMRWFKHGNSHFDLKTLKKTNTKSMFVFNLRQSLLRLLSQLLSLMKFRKRPTITIKGFSISL
ncbi:transposase, partial [Streptococcus dysgalactiae]